MRKNYPLFIIIAFAFLLTGFAMMTPGLKETNPVGKVYRDSIQVWDRTIPLPEGEWKVMTTGIAGGLIKAL